MTVTFKKKKKKSATTTKKKTQKFKYIKFFHELRIKDVPLVGGKNASLGEMIVALGKKGVQVPDGFAVTAKGYDHFIQGAGLDKEIKKILKGLNTHDVRDLAKRGAQVRRAILSAELPDDLKEEISRAYTLLSKQYEKKGKHTDVAVRSSATAEDLPDASFAGQQETYLNIHTDAGLIEASKRCFASLFTNRAISYRQDKKFSHFDVKLSIGVQKMVRSDVGTSGVMFTLDTESGFKDVVMINAIYGLGENIVQGKANPDEFLVFKPTYKAGYHKVLSKKLGSKALRMVYSKKKGKTVEDLKVSPKDQAKYAITDEQALKLAEWAMIIEEHYKKPMDIEWAGDGKTGELYIVQARPETIHGQDSGAVLEKFHLSKRGTVLTEGIAVGAKIGAGNVNVIMSAKDMHKFKPGEVLVTDITDPDWEPIMKIASAIVTNRGGRTSHAAIVSREMGIPAIVGTGEATKKLKKGKAVTVSCAEGETGFVYKGTLSFTLKKTHLGKLGKPKTHIMMNLANPDGAFHHAALPHRGIGLARVEFVINNYIKIHPLALLNFSKLKDKKAKTEIAKLTAGYKDKRQYFIERLAEGVAKLAAAFHPEDVIVRLSDFKSNEYAALIGGKEFEPEEANPMIGWRGASRYYDPVFRPAFDLECQAMKYVREELGLKNLKLMVPFCRTVDEGKKVLSVMKENGLVQGKDRLQVYVMAEIPSNVILAEDFAKIFDGFSIGSNDLTQLILGVDRDSSLVAHVYNELDPAVLSRIEHLIKVAKKHNCKVGICGQGPSDHPELAKFLVQHGIDSMSLNPDTVLQTTIDVLKLEKGGKKKRTKK